MTQAQVTQLEEAIERATEHNIIVPAQGRFKADNSRFFLTNSASTKGLHVVKLYGRRLSCDCKGSRQGYICQHRASVYIHLQVQAAKRQVQAEAIEAALEAENAPKTTTDAMRADSQLAGWAALLRRSNAAISIWK